MNHFLFISGLVILAIAVLYEQFVSANLQLVDNLNWTICYTLGAICSWTGVKEAGEWKKVRFFLALGATSHAIGQYVWDVQLYYNMIFFPGPSDILFVINGIFATFASVFSIYTIKFHESRKTLLIDGMSISIILLILILAMYIPKQGNYTLLQLSTFAAYPLFFLTAATIFCMLYFSNGNHFKTENVVFLLGSLGYGIVWLEWNDLFLRDILKDGMVLGYGFSLTSLLFGYGASKWELKEDTQVNIYNQSLRFLPVVKVSIVSLLLIYIWTIGEHPFSVKITAGIGTIIVIFFASTRQMFIIQEKILAETNLRNLNRELEEIISSRTSELRESNDSLTQAIQNLKDTQYHLIQSEKLATLGQLVGSIAHEINTPLAAISSSSSMIKSVIHEDIEPTFFHFKNFTDIETECWLTFFRGGLSRGYKFDLKENKENLKKIIPLFVGKGLNAKYISEILVDFGITIDTIPKSLFQFEGDRITEIVESVKVFIDLTRASQIISESVDRSSKVIRSLKTYLHQADSSQLESVNLLTQIENLIFLYFKKFSKTVSIKLEISSAIEILCYADELNQIWTNLLSNAFQAMEYKGEITIHAVEEDDKVEIHFKDNGPGISEEIQSKIFDAFFTTKKIGEGTGLGLAIVKSIIERHKGTISLTSDSTGTEFTIILPKNQI